ncbi:hypothetical protein [uncultured Clostridium sp.]|jgi:hypothetical protein|uniref:hypothetical protein n=1 Tax=uncultured Clostridium sp. TaxID=59620 RepID=UPI00262DE65F|nr:hypothetical protein [uncultured Clostridium sp.]
MDQITKGMEGMNLQILQGNINFKVEGNKTVKTESVNKDAVNKAFFQDTYKGFGFNFMSDQFVHTYCYNFHYNWYGFYCAVNLQGCRVLINELQLTIASAGGLTAVTALTGNVIISTGCGLEAVYAGVIQSNLQLGVQRGTGATISAWGSPMGKAIIYTATPNN